MRIMFDKTTKVITGVIAERVTNHIPPSYVGENGDFIDIDYDHEALQENILAQTLEKEGANLVGKTIEFKDKDVVFHDKTEKQYMETVMIDLENPKLDKDVEIYTKKAENKGARVEIDDVGTTIVVKIKNKDKVVGTMILEKRGCCTYVYDTGIVGEREFYPHYIGFSELIKYLQKKKIKWIDMGGLLKKDDDLNTFKKKWGKSTLVEVTWQ